MRVAPHSPMLPIVFAVLVLIGAAPVKAGESPRPDEKRLVDLVNGERTARGLGALVWDGTLARLARDHAADMLRMGQATHASSADGAGFTQRLARSDMRAGAAAENVAYAHDVVRAHRGLMNSPGHRANILNGDLTAIGIGIVEAPEGGRIYVVQDFATPLIDLDDAAATDAVRRALSEGRRRRGGTALPEESHLTERSAAALERLVLADSVQVDADVVAGPGWIIAYTTTDPRGLHDSALRELGRATAFGAAVTYRRTPSYPFGIYWVVLALKTAG